MNRRPNYQLLNEKPILLFPKLAARIGLNEAIILQQFNYWLVTNEEAGTGKYQDRFWTYNTYEQWQEQFPFLTPRTIRRTIRNLEGMGLVISRQENNTNRKKFYTIDYDEFYQLP